MVVKRDARAEGIGTAFLNWIEGELRREKVASVFIETGMSNASAHAFFEKRGYAPVSRVMIKVLREARRKDI